MEAVAEIIFVKEKGKDRKSLVINLEEFISVKGWKALGNKLTNKKVKEIKWLESLDYNSDNNIDNEEDKSNYESETNTDKLELNEEIKKPNVSDEGTQQISLDL